MKINKTYICLITGLIVASCATKHYEKTGDGIIMNFNKTKSSGLSKLRLQVLGDELIHVSATAENEFPKDSSLIIVPHFGTTAFTVSTLKDSVKLATASLNLMVSSRDGGIKFKDKNGKLILSEKSGKSKTFNPIKVEETNGYTVRQIFESPKDEAFYGLGQHQSDEFNYKDKTEELFQYNTKVSVPFIVSNKNYGLLWDSYSLSRFGDSRPYEQLNNVFKLFDKNGESGSLTGTYNTQDNGKINLVRKETSIFFEDVKSFKNLPENFPLKNAEVTYEGDIEAPQNGEYKFTLYYSGYVKVYLNNQLVVPERWRTAWNPNSYKFSVNLEGGKRVPLRIE